MTILLSTKKRIALAVLAALFLGISACSNEELTAQNIIDKVIETHGGKAYEHSTILFNFRDRDYRIHRDGGIFTYERMFTDSLGYYHDYLNNHYFVRELNEAHLPLSSEDSIRYANSLNSVIYFALLPYPLNDAAVYKTLLGQEAIHGVNYHKIKVTFSPEGGGQDYEDQYLYWIHPETFTMDYLAYNFKENEGGTRFRSVSERQVINGITFQNYVNYKGPNGSLDIEPLGRLYAEQKLEKLSDINLENIQVIRD